MAGVPTPSPVSDEWLREHYIDKEWSMKRIGAFIGRSEGYVRRILAEAGISTRRRGYVPPTKVASAVPKPTGIVCPECGHEFQRNLREARLAKGLTLKELAARCGVHDGTISKLERGQHGAAATLRLELSKQLGIPYYEIPLSVRETPEEQ